MKKIILLSAFAAIAAVACTKENINDASQPSASVPTKTVAFTAESLTKTTVDLVGKVAWEEGDSISVYYVASDSTAIEVVAAAALEGGKAKFAIEIPETENPVRYYASYPAHYGTLVPGESDSFGIKVVSGDGSFAKSNIMAACTSAEAGNFAFKNACGMFRIKLPEGGKIKKGTQEYTIKHIRIKGQTVSINSTSDLPVPVIITGNEVSGFGEPAKYAANTNAYNIPAEVLESGYAYLPSLPGEASKGIYVQYTTAEGVSIPAVLSDNTQAVAIVRGNIKPVPDAASKMVFDYYVSASGSGDGKSEGSPMSFAAMTEMFKTCAKYMFGTAALDGVTFHLKGETFDASAEVAFPTNASYSATTAIEGGWQGGSTVLDGGSKVRFSYNNKNTLIFKNITFQNGNSGSEAGSAISVKDGNLEVIGCRFIDNQCTGNSGCVFIQSSFTGHAYFTNCIFTGNTTGGNYGASIHCAAPTTAKVGASSFLGVNNCLFINNTGTKQANNSNINPGISHCIVNTSIISQAADKNGQALRLGPNTYCGEEGGAFIVNSIINNENTAENTYSLNCVNNKYWLRSTGYNQYSTANTVQFTTAGNDNQVGLPCEGTSAGLNTYTWNKATCAWDWDASSKTYSMADLATLEDLVENDKLNGSATAVQPKAKAFLSWLKGISYNDGADNAFTVDLYGTHRNADNIWPGCYQK